MLEREKRAAAAHPNSRARAKLERTALSAVCELLLDVKGPQALTEQRLAELKAPMALFLEVTKRV